ncbi:MAG TPA: hypothetical protein VHC40_09565 [Rhizomicrobium sp.]|nr:hypothetical protein [Rhizomicrobium sp.]
MSGSQWCARFPESRSLDDLLPDFARRVRAFLAQLAHAGAVVSIADTWRAPERAYLMHWCCMIAKGGQDPDAVPPMTGVDIDWVCGGDRARARAAAAAMMKGYGIVFPAALASRHTQRRAVDMTIRWRGALDLRDAEGRAQAVTGTPRNGTHPGLVAVGASFGVMKLLSDPPHWSDDGH